MKTCILIQTCDKYTHLWEGLQLSYHFNWCWDLSLPIYVLTEEKIFSNDERFKTLSFGYCGEPPFNFSTRLINALEFLKENGYDSVLYSQDDFWPLKDVDVDIMKQSLNFLSTDGVDCIHVNEYLPWYQYTLSKTEHYIRGKQIRKYEVPSMYYYNHQAAFWKIDSLLKIQNRGESVSINCEYDNECKGTERAWQIPSNYYFLSYDWYKAEFINSKGILLPTAESLVRDWKFRLEWEK